MNNLWSNIFVALAVICPLSAFLFVGWQIHKKKLKEWQTHTCFAGLAGILSIIFLIAAGRIAAIDLSGKVQMVQVTAEEMQKVAIATADLVAFQAQYFAGDEPVNFRKSFEGLRARTAVLLKVANAPEKEAADTLATIDRAISSLTEQNKRVNQK